MVPAEFVGPPGPPRPRRHPDTPSLAAAVAAVAAHRAEPAAVGPVMVPIVVEDDIPLTWDPVPVPRPTYTMKAKAERAEVAPAEVTPDPVHRGAGGREDDRSYEQRRVAGA